MRWNYKALLGLLLIPVLECAAAVAIGVQPSSLGFNTTGSDSQTLSITSADEALDFSLETADPWLDVSPKIGTTPATVRVTVNAAGLPAGARTGRIVVIAPQAVSPRVEVPVTLTVPSVMRLSPESLAFTTAGQASQNVTLTTSGGPPLAFSAASGAAWLSVSPKSGTTPVTLSVTVSAAGLSGGTFEDSITITAAGAANSTLKLPVRLTVPGTGLSVTPGSLTFNTTGVASQTLSITTGGAGNWTAAATGYAWLSVSPASGTAPGTLTVTADPAGLAAGSYNGSVTITAPGVPNSPQTVAVALIVPSSTVALVILQSGLTFQHQVNTSPPGTQDIVVTTTGGPLGFRASVEIKQPPGSRWLSVSPTSGTAPAVLKLAVNPSGLDPGGYEAEVTISGQPGGTATVPVRLVVTNPVASSLGLDVDSLSFSYSQTAGAQSRQLRVTNPSNSLLRFQIQSETEAGGGWLKVTPDRGDVGASLPTTLLVTADPAGLDAGSYTGRLVLLSPAGDQRVEVPVVMTISRSRQRVHVSETGLTFTVVADSGVNDLPQDFAVVNAGEGSMAWTAEARVMSGGRQWLAVTPASGVSVAGGQVPQARVSANAAGVAPGEYHGEVLVRSEGADNSPYPVAVVLRVLPAGSTPGPALVPNGLIFTGVAGGANPAAQNAMVLNRAGRVTSAAMSKVTLNGGNWLNHSPASLNFAGVSVSNATVSVQVGTAGLAPGIYEGRIMVSFPGGVNRVINVLLVLSAGGGAGPAGMRMAAACIPSKYLPLFTSVEDQFVVSAGAPARTRVAVVDDCGNPAPSGSVGAAFTNRDRSLTLSPLSDGQWTATWVPANSRTAAVTVQVTAADPLGRVDVGSVPVSGFIRDASLGPLVDRAKGVMNAATLRPGGPLAPGELIAIFGERMAAAGEETVVTLGDSKLAVQSAAEGRILAVVPAQTPVNVSQQLVVRRGATLSAPESVDVAAAAPGIFTQDETGRGAGQIYVAREGGEPALVTRDNPARAGERVILVATGLGSADNQVSVTIGGIEAPLLGVDQQPERPGYYLVSASVPVGMPAGEALPVVLKSSRQSSPAVTIAVR